MKKLFRLARDALRDRQILRGRTSNSPSIDFAFLVHPRDVHDIHRKYPILRLLGKRGTLWLMKHFWPVRVAPIRGLTRHDGIHLRGYIIACPYTAGQLMTDRDAAREQILTTAKLAYNLGARYIGLGALTASLSRGGLDVHEHYPVEIATGRFYTVINIAELVQHSLEALDIPVATACVTIVGAAGSIGAGVAQVLAYKGIRHLTLIDLTDKRADVDSVCKHINTEQQGMTMTVLDAMQEPFVADIIVTATNKPNALIQKKHVLPGTVIVDDAQPSDVAAELLEDPDYLVLEGGVVHSHDITIPFDMGLQQPGDIFSCLAELLIIAEGSVPISSPLGRELIIDQDLMKKLQRRAVRLQFTAGDFQNQHKLYTKEEVARVRDTRAARV